MNGEIINGLSWFGLGVGVVMVFVVLDQLLRHLTNTFGARPAQ